MQVFAFLLLTSLQSPDVTLARGVALTGPFAGVKDRYWDVSEAEIDSSGADYSIPTMFALTGTSQRKVLLRFGSLDIALSRNSKIVDGTLTLPLPEREHAALKSVKILKRPWLTPGVNILFPKMLSNPKPQDPKSTKIEVPFAAGVTWNKAGGDNTPWQSAGASGANDSESIEAKFTVKDNFLVVSNIGSTLQYWKTHEGENYGFLLEFGSETGIWTSTSPEARPSLQLKLEQATVKDPHFTISHNGNSVTLNSTEPIANVDVYQGVRKIGSNEATTISLPTDSPSKDPRGRLIRLVATYKDSSIPQDVVTVDPTAPWVPLTPATTRRWNQWYVDQSFYSISKYGAGKYVNGEGDKDGAFPPIPGVEQFGSGSHMMETMLNPGLNVPPRTTRNALFRQVVTTEGGPLSLAQVDFLMNGKVQFPSVILGKLVNYDGRAIPDATVSVLTSAGETKDLKADSSGVLILPKFQPGTTGNVTITVNSFGQTGTLTTPVSTFSDLYARGNTRAISLDLPFNLSPWPINEDANLVAGKPAKDSANSFPAQLIGLTDDNPDTEYTLTAKGWVEIDLGRDRTLGEIIFQGEMPKQFKVLVYGTVDKFEQADQWINEEDVDKFRREYDVQGDLIYRPSPNEGRYIRIQNLTDRPVKLKGLKVYAARKPSS